MIANGVTIPRIAEGGPPLLAIAAGFADVARASTLFETAARLREECAMPRGIVELARTVVELAHVPHFELPRVAPVQLPRMTELADWRVLHGAYASEMSIVARADIPTPTQATHPTPLRPPQ